MDERPFWKKTEKNPNSTYRYWKRAHEKMKMRDFEGAVEEFDATSRSSSILSITGF